MKTIILVAMFAGIAIAYDVAPRPGPEACPLEKDPGPCYGAFPRFFYNKRTGQCEEFIYGGCFGNANNFNSKDECEAVCSRPLYCPRDVTACAPESKYNECCGDFQCFFGAICCKEYCGNKCRKPDNKYNDVERQKEWDKTCLPGNQK